MSSRGRYTRTRTTTSNPTGTTTASPSTSPSASEESHHLTSPTAQSPQFHTPTFPSHDDQAEVDTLRPPRPGFFLSSERGSWSSQDGGGSPSASDSERDEGNASASAGRRAGMANVAGVGAGRGGARRNSRGYGVAVVEPTATQVQAQAAQAQARPRNHHRRRSSGINTQSNNGNYIAAYPAAEDSPTSSDPFSTPSLTQQQQQQGGGGWSPASLYRDSYPPPNGTGSVRAPPAVNGERAPPSSYPFPFQSYPGNPDPGTNIPGVTSRRSSTESMHGGTRERSSTLPGSGGGGSNDGHIYMVGGNQQGGYAALNQRANSATDLTNANELGRPFAPFMAGAAPGEGSPRSSGYGVGNVYRNSAAAAMVNGSQSQIATYGGVEGAAMPLTPNLTGNGLPRTSSVNTFRAPFLSPASRPTSSLWTPPAYPYVHPSGSSGALSIPRNKPPAPSTRIEAKLTAEDKPWLKQKDSGGRWSWWLTVFGLFLGFAGAGVLCWRGYAGVYRLEDSQLCMVFEDDFDSLDTTNNWNQVVELGGFGNGDFEMTVSSSDNTYASNGELYIFPTLTSDEIGTSSIFDGYDYKLSDCTTDNATACEVQSSNSTHTVVNPVKSGRLNTKGKYSIAYGKVEVRAKLPQGDWLWPAIWMLPEDEEYGEWPVSGEIDIMEARGNDASYAAQGVNYARASLIYGPLETLINKIYGWQSQKRSSYADGFHLYALEWDSQFMRLYLDNRIHAMLDLTMTKSFWDRAEFPSTAQNGSTEVVVTNPYSGSGNSAPYDKNFYLILSLAAGGTSGWFPDNVGNKPWYDGSATAMYDFAYAQDTWYSTWPSDADSRAFRIDYVKMWSLC